MRPGHRMILVCALAGLLQGCGAVVVQGVRQIYAALNTPDKATGAALDQFGQYLQAQDLDGIGALLAPDARWEDPAALLAGREDILHHLRGCARNAGTLYELRPTQTAVHGHRATQQGSIRQTGSDTDGTAWQREGHFDAEWSRTGQGPWLLARWTASLAPGGPADAGCNAR